MKLPRENDEGKVEYKLILSSVTPDRLQELATQMKYRLEEGDGEAFYVIGVSDEGEIIGLSKGQLEESIATLNMITRLVNAKIVYRRDVEVRRDKYVAELLVRRYKENLPVEVNVAVMGHVNAGKSTVTGALVLGRLDDGNGGLRTAIARHLHEVLSGRTSSITLRVIGFDDSGKIVNWQLKDPLDEAETTIKSTKIVRLIDLGGHERYLRTTLKGLLGYEVNYVMLVVGADDGLSIMGKEHLALASVLKFPIFVVITKVDKYPEDRIKGIVNDIKSVLKIPGINRLALEVEDEDDVVNSILAIKTRRVVPIFKISNVSGKGLDLLIKFLNLLPPEAKNLDDRGAPLVYIDEIYNVTGVGTVVLGSVVRGKLNNNESVLIGPNKLGEFKEVKIKSIQVNKVFVDSVLAGNIATFAIQGIEKESLRKGMVMVKGIPKVVRRFKARVFILHHPTTIREGYVATLHSYTIRQAVKFEKIQTGFLRTGDTSEIVLYFLYRPEYLEKGQIFVFREGRTRGVGIVLEPIG
ncbi:elongation factor 1-alpha [Saccharolobus solfataricus]|uniref:Elongation factor 1-alpha n=3 Tax=Saccharolobus solfataricus TaxID=2287 RepID=A0A0E3MF09_SACSO|nr:GTPBP1 family GTP-binding protein [Saccharolobus solfataricus]AAK42573.1 Elongation factor 1-alpha, putative (tuF-2) [Saccharolobus solfataricus P2]AKA72665.1 elongation factor 1-alpha [Saccharolobus solfataricus]AKA75365.1 elongation factor 1-alpha [Saccharolobus solfataricus]AKA78057.1 elongation factor 1-alpha [Saccharolobus solfataricus]AZF67178.1 elongation factor 1-alpha [Saccharolobus solfataricus]